MRSFAKRFAVIAYLLAATSLLLFSCANNGAEVVSSLSDSSAESTTSEDAVLTQEASSDIQTESSLAEISSEKEAPSGDSPEVAGTTSSKKPAASSTTPSSSKAAASSKAASSKAASSKVTSSKVTSSKPASSAPSGGSGGSGYGPRISDDPSKSSNTSFYAGVEDEILAQLNDLRQSKGLNPLKKSSQLAAGARIRAKEMYDYNYFAHTRPDGGSWDSVFKIDIKLSNYSRLGENLVKMVGSSPEATAIMNLWINSPGHYANMVNPDYTHVGIGVFSGTVSGQGKTLYAVQEFGTFY